MNSALKAVLSIVAAIAVASSIAGCTSGTTTVGAPTEIAHQSQSRSMVYTNDEGLITKYIDGNRIVQFEEGYTSTDTEVATPTPQYGPTDSILVEGTIDIEGKAYPISSDIYVDFTPMTYELIPLYNEYVVPKLTDSTLLSPGYPYNLSDYSIQEIVSDFVGSDIRKAIQNDALPAVQHMPNGKATIFTDSNIAQAQLDGVSARDAYSRFILGMTNDTSEYAYSYSCGLYGVELDGTELETALAARFPNMGAIFYVDRNVAEIRVETEQPCDVVESTPGVPVTDPMSYSGPDAPNGYIDPPEEY